MKLTASRDSLVKPLQAVMGVVERRQTMPILSNVLLSAADGNLSVSATDIEVELVARATVDEVAVPGEITVPARKLLDICRALPAGAAVTIALNGDRVAVTSGRSKFVLSTLPADDFPLVEEMEATHSFTISQAELQRLLDKTHFAMAQQDVRYYLNGLLLETDKDTVRAVATDGHRLALCEAEVGGVAAGGQVIVPRKGVIELQRLLDDEGDVTIEIGANHIRADLSSTRFTSKLIDGRFPDYSRVIPDAASEQIQSDKDPLSQALQRASILSNEKYRGVRLELKPNSLRIQANNPEHEEAEDEVEVEYGGDTMEVGFNVNYLLDALSAVDGEAVTIGLADPSSSCLIQSPEAADCKYVVMPMRL